MLAQLQSMCRPYHFEISWEWQVMNLGQLRMKWIGVCLFGLIHITIEGTK